MNRKGKKNDDCHKLSTSSVGKITGDWSSIRGFVSIDEKFYWMRIAVYCYSFVIYWHLRCYVFPSRYFITLSYKTEFLKKGVVIATIPIPWNVPIHLKLHYWICIYDWIPQRLISNYWFHKPAHFRNRNKEIKFVQLI